MKSQNSKEKRKKSVEYSDVISLKKINYSRFLANKWDLLMILILIIIILNLQFFGIYGRTTFLRDWTIVFEGSYRISIGQIPYKDFFMPMGPIVFIIQAFFNTLFGINVFSMMIHAFLLSIILSLIFYSHVRKEFGFFISFIFAFFLYLSFNGLAFHPFYNYTTYFFLFLNIFLILSYIKREKLPGYVYFLSAILGTLDFYTKQDTGALHLGLLLIFFLINYKRDWKRILLFYFIPFIVLVLGTFLLLSNLEGFTYWFNLGQPPHNPRITKFFDPKKIVMITSSWHFYVGLIFVYLILFKKIKKDYNKRIMSLFLVLAITHLINNTLSGSTRQLSVMGLPILIFFAYITIKDYIPTLKKDHKVILGLILIIILVVNINPFPTYGLITLNYLNPNIKSIAEGCYSNVKINNDRYIQLQRLREIIEKNNNSFISMTEYSFLYCDYQKDPPKNLPIWFDEGISFYDENVNSIINTIINKNPKIILVQNAHGHENPYLNDYFIKTFIDFGYEKLEVIKNTESPITVLIRINN